MQEQLLIRLSILGQPPINIMVIMNIEKPNCFVVPLKPESTNRHFLQIFIWLTISFYFLSFSVCAGIFIDDRALFDMSLTENVGETIIDSNNNFAPDSPIATGQASVTRSGTIGGDSYTYLIYDIDFSNSPVGSLTPGSVGGDINDLDIINTEQPASQGAATGSGSWGVDTATGQNTTRNALLFDFTVTPGSLGIGHFGVELHDTEGIPTGIPVEYHIYNNGTLIDQGVIDWGAGNNGNNESHFFGYIAEEDSARFDQIVILVGDDNLTGNGNRERLAADRFTFGSAYSAVDFGDAAGYSTASHVRLINEPHLGVNMGDADPVTSPQTDVTATADNSNGIDDEDGVIFSSTAGGNTEIIATVTVNNPTGSDVTLCGWLDVDLSSSFELGERQCNTALDPSTNFSWTVNSILTQNYFSRFRVCAITAECNIPNGSASGGEVEDYRIPYNPTAATIGQVQLKPYSVTGFLSMLNFDQMSQQLLQKILQGWSPSLATELVNANREEIQIAIESYLDPDGDGQVAVLHWDTLEERGTIGFFVERSITKGEWILVNNDMLPGLITAPMGGEYMLVDITAHSGIIYQYRIIEQEANGNSRQYGPYSMEIKESMLNRVSN